MTTDTNTDAALVLREALAEWPAEGARLVTQEMRRCIVAILARLEAAERPATQPEVEAALVRTIARSMRHASAVGGPYVAPAVIDHATLRAALAQRDDCVCVPRAVLEAWRTSTQAGTYASVRTFVAADLLREYGTTPEPKPTEEGL